MSTPPRALHEFARLDNVVLIDCEFTCWEDSLRTRWADPRRPPELIEIALAEYHVQRDQVDHVFTSLVRPRVNPELSAYCKRVVAITQQEVDDAPPLPEVLRQVEAWLSRRGLRGATICEWGTGDLPHIAQDAARYGCASPFEDAPHVPLRDLYESVFGVLGDSDRDTVRARFRLGANPNRHRALADALDLAQFCAHLRKTATGS